MSPARPPALVLGVPIDDLTMAGAVELVGQLVDNGRADGRTHQVATVNVDFIVNSIADPAVCRLLQHADVCIADGAPVVWGARMGGMPLTERIAGADLVPALAARSAERGWRIHLFGSAPGTAERAAQIMNDRFPAASITGDSGPMMSDVATINAEVLASLAAVDADIYCIALGNPKQERFIATYREALGAPVMIGVGGTLDFIVGGRRRAPAWAQRVGLEWVFRALQEPTRLGRRYAHDARVFFPQLIRYLRSLHRSAARGSGLRYEIDGSDVVVLPSDTALNSWSDAAAAVESGGAIEVDARCASALSVEALCDLVGLLRIAARSKCRSVSFDASPAVHAQLERLGLATYFAQAETLGSRRSS